MRRPSYANVTASLALFVALGGTSYAVVKLPRNSVGSLQVRDGSLKSSDLSRAARKGGPRGPRGAQGPAGTAGAPGERGPSSVRIARPGASVTLASSPQVRTTVRRMDAVPAGVWTLRFDANAYWEGSGMHAVCALRVNGDDVVSSSVVVGVTPNATQEAGLPIETVVQRPSPFNVTAECSHTAEGAMVIVRPQIIATQVADLVEVP